MPKKGKISDLYDIQSMEGQQAKVIGLVDTFLEKINQVKPIRIKLDGAEKTKDVVSGVNDMSTAMKEYERIASSVQKLHTQFSINYQDQAKKLAELKIAQQQHNTEVKEEIQLNQSAEGSIKQKQIQLKQLQRTYDQLSASQRESFDGKALLSSIQDADKSLKDLEGSTGRHQRKVGDYVGAIRILEKSLQDVKSKMSDLTNAGQQNSEEMQKMEEQSTLLETLLGQQSKGYASLTFEIRGAEQALFAMQEAGLGNTTEFEQLRAKVAGARSALSEFNQEQHLLSSAAPGLTALTVAARGLAGAYAVGAGAAALFADGDEKVQKEIAKLVAIMTILQGLEEAHKLLQERGAIATALQSTATKAAAIVQRIYAATVLESAAATTALRIAVGLATGGLLLLLPLAAFAFNKLAESQKASRRETELNNELAKKSIENYGNEAASARILVEEFKNEGTSRKRKKEIVDLLKDQFPNYFKNLNDEHTSVKQLTDDYDKFSQAILLNAKIKAAQDLITEKQKKIFELEQNGIEENIGFFRKAALSLDLFTNNASDVAKTFGNAADDTKEQIGDLTKDIDGLVKKASATSVELAKLGGDPFGKDKKLTDKAPKNDFIKQILDAADRERKARVEILKQEISDDARAQEQLAETESRGLADRLQNVDDFYSDQFALFNIDKQLELKAIQAKLSAIAALEKKSKKDLTEEDKKLIIEKKALQEESIAVQGELQGKENELLLQGQQKKLEVIKSALDKEDSFREDQQKRRLNAIDSEEQSQRGALEEQYSRNLVSLEDFEKKKEIIQNNAEIKRLQQQVKNAFEIFFLAQQRGQDTADLEKKLADASISLDDYVTGKKLENQKKLRDVQIKFMGDVADAFGEFTGFQFDKEKNAIQDQINQLEAKKQKEIEVINATVTNEQDKAAAITTINARADAQQKQLEQRQRDLDYRKGQFEKVSGLLKVGIETATSVFKIQAEAAVLKANPITAPLAAIALAQIPFVIAGGALAAGLIAARPVPKYALGVDDHPGGLAFVGDGGKKEIVATKSGMYITPDTPTLVNLPEHATVYPDAERIMRNLEYSAINNLRAINSGSISDKMLQQGMTKALERKLDALNETVKNKKELHVRGSASGMKMLHVWAQREVTYVHEQTNW